MIVYLIGYMGCGKTTLGEQLAKAMSYNFIDLDDFIEKSEKRTISQIFEQEGEAGFRGLEQKHLNILKDYNKLVVSTGGGTPCFYNNMEFMNKTGITIYLEMDVRSLCYRLQHGQKHRPLLRDKSEAELAQFVKQHLQERLPYYQQSQLTINAMGFDKNKTEILANTLIEAQL